MTSEKALKWHRMNYQGFIETMWDGHEDNPFMDAFEMSIQALEKQIPKKPVVKTDNILFKTVHCPACDSTDIKDSEGCELNFCNNCGQAIDWSED